MLNNTNSDNEGEPKSNTNSDNEGEPKNNESESKNKEKVFFPIMFIFVYFVVVLFLYCVNSSSLIKNFLFLLSNRKRHQKRKKVRKRIKKRQRKKKVKKFQRIKHQQ